MAKVREFGKASNSPMNLFGHHLLTPLVFTLPSHGFARYSFNHIRVCDTVIFDIVPRVLFLLHVCTIGKIFLKSSRKCEKFPGKEFEEVKRMSIKYRIKEREREKEL